MKHSYALEGDYEVILIVRDHDGDFSEASIILNIKAEATPQLPPAQEPPEDEQQDTGGAPPAPITPNEDEPTPEEPPSTTGQGLQPYEQPTPGLINIISDSSQELTEQIITHAIEIILGSSFVGTTFIMEVVLPPGSKGDEDSNSGEPTEDNDEE